MDSCSNQKSVKQIKMYFFNVATLCLDDSFAHTWHFLNQLHEEVDSRFNFGLEMLTVSNQISVEQIEIIQLATLCLDDSFAHSWHSLNQLHLELFFNILEGVPTC